MYETSKTYDPYRDVRRVNVSFTFSAVAPDAAADASLTANNESVISAAEQILQGQASMHAKCATLEPGMYLLDGTFMPYGDSAADRGHVGYQSSVISDLDKVFTTLPVLYFSFSKVQSSYGFTLIFDNTMPDNFPKTVQMVAFSASGAILANITGHPESALFRINTQVDNYKTIGFSFQGTNIPNRRIRICGIIFGLIYNYDRNNIVDFSSQQSISILAENLPSTQVTATIDNSDKLYNMLNPSGLYKYLQDGQYMDWSIDIDGESVKMGRLFFSSASSEDDGLTAKLIFHDALYTMDNLYYNNGYDGSGTLEELIADVLAAAALDVNTVFDDDIASRTVGFNVPQETTIRETIRLAAQAAMCTAYIDRDHCLHFSAVKEKTAVDTLTSDVQVTAAQADVDQQYNAVRLTQNNDYIEDYEERQYYASNIADGVQEKIYKAENPLVLDGDSVAAWILEMVMRRTNYSVRTRGNPALDLLDYVKIEDVFSVNGTAAITKLNYNFDGGLTNDIEASQ